MPRQNAHFPMCPSALSPPDLPGPGSGPQSQPLGLDKPGKRPPGSGEAAALQEVRSVCVCVRVCVCSVHVCLCVLGGGVCGLYRCWEKPPNVGLALKLEHLELERGGL